MSDLKLQEYEGGTVSDRETLSYDVSVATDENCEPCTTTAPVTFSYVCVVYEVLPLILTDVAAAAVYVTSRPLLCDVPESLCQLAQGHDNGSVVGQNV